MPQYGAAVAAGAAATTPVPTPTTSAHTTDQRLMLFDDCVMAMPPFPYADRRAAVLGVAFGRGSPLGGSSCRDHVHRPRHRAEATQDMVSAHPVCNRPQTTERVYPGVERAGTVDLTDMAPQSVRPASSDRVSRICRHLTVKWDLLTGSCKSCDRSGVCPGSRLVIDRDLDRCGVRDGFVGSGWTGADRAGVVAG